MTSFYFPWRKALFCLLAITTSAQYPPTSNYPNILKSPLNPNITITYKQPDAGTCQTAFETQKQYTGYIGLPPMTLAPIEQNYSINTFFWFVEARQTPEIAPLTIWLSGGPGTSSMFGLFVELGPCKVVQVNDGSYGTQNNIWGWDRSSNLLFIDQPNNVGFSYDTPTNASFDFFHDEIFEPPTPPVSALPPFMYRNGTFSTANSNEDDPWQSTANTTEIAAQATWHFLQTWLAAFPQYNPALRPNSTNLARTTTPVGINLFTESYGGKYGPVFANLFEEQNQKRINGRLPFNQTLEIQLETLGIINGLVDDAIQVPLYPAFAYNNTFGIQAIDTTQYINSLQVDVYGADGCLAQIHGCRRAMNATDPEGYGDVNATNQLCRKAVYACAEVSLPYYQTYLDPYDIRQHLPSPFPPADYQEYLNTASVLASIGARVNYTESSPYVQAGFIATGDAIRGGQIQDLADLLSRGIRVALIYGDADYICNWFGGEAVSLALAAETSQYPFDDGVTPYSTAFPDAGYAEIVTNATYVGGAVRQYGNLSFSRIYNAGHFVPFFQPETAFTVFTRIIQGADIATGEVVDLSFYNSTGPPNATYSESPPSSTPAPTCWIRSWNSSCSQDDTSAMLAGQGGIMHGIYYRDTSSVVLPSSSVTAASPGWPVKATSESVVMADSTSSAPLTGVYTATSTPTPSSGASHCAAYSGGAQGAIAVTFVLGVFVWL